MHHKKRTSPPVAADSGAQPADSAAAAGQPGPGTAAPPESGPCAAPDESDDRSLRVAAQAAAQAAAQNAETPAASPSPGERKQGEGRPLLDAGILTHEPFVGDQYNQTYLYALPRNAHAVYVFWEVSSGTRDHLKQRFGKDFFDHGRHYLVLRVRRTDTNHCFDVEDYLDDKNSYWLKLDPNVEYEMELGYRAKGTTYFERVAVSNRCRTQPEADTKHEAQNDTREVQVQDYSHEIPVRQEHWRLNFYEYWKRRKVVNKPDEKGYWSLVLHMHLPFVRHLEYDVSLEEQWLFEAITNCYAQLLNVFWNLERDKLDFRITVTISPPLISMLTDAALQQRYWEYLRESIALAERELDAHRGKAFQHTLETILERLHTAKRVWDAYKGNILQGFKDFQDMGKVEIIAVAGTHPILPFYLHYPEVVRGHIQLACRQYQRVFGRWPRGMWMPENAFTPGVDYFLAKEGIKWTLVHSSGILRGSTRPWYGTSRPVVTHNGLAVFGIDEDSGSQVWSREAGYPGDPRYKEWYRDLGFDASWDYLPPYWQACKVRRNTGLKYYRITSRTTKLHEKEPYNPEWARQAVNEQSGQFVHHRGAQVTHLNGKHHVKPCIVSAYDAELFGHWWEEGPAWIEMVMRKMLGDQDQVRLATPSEFLVEERRHQLLMPGVSSWGAKGTFQSWLDGRQYQPNVWIYRHLFRIADQLTDLATQHVTADGDLRRALNQAAREMMLAQASDWAFLMSMGTTTRYSELRTIKHVGRARELLRQAAAGALDAHFLDTLEAADNLLPQDMDFRVFCRG
jgi:1,4-alpha-glucan branching enzyme